VKYRRHRKGEGMDPALKRRWVRALRSGDYAKGKHALCTVVDGEATYCCLGVLHELVHGTDGWRGPPDGDGHLRPKEHDPETTTNETFYGSALVGRKNAEQLATINDGSDTFDPVVEYIVENL
jgi:hypothetical protein